MERRWQGRWLKKGAEKPGTAPVNKNSGGIELVNKSKGYGWQFTSIHGNPYYESLLRYKRRRSPRIEKRCSPRIKEKGWRCWERC